MRVCAVYSLQIIFRRRGEAELCAYEILEDCAIVAADRAVRFIADDELEIGGSELVQESIAGRKTLDCGHNDLRVLPLLPLLFVDHRLNAVIREVGSEISPCLIL